MKRMAAIALAVGSLAASVSFADAQTKTGPAPEVRPDTVIQVQGRPPPWGACRRWDPRRHICLDAGWGHRNWRPWYSRRSCMRGHGWWIDSWGRWRRC